MFMPIYPKSTTRPVQEIGTASPYGGPRLRLLWVGMVRVSLWIVIIGLLAGSGAFAQDDGSACWLELASITPRETAGLGDPVNHLIREPRGGSDQ